MYLLYAGINILTSVAMFLTFFSFEIYLQNEKSEVDKVEKELPFTFKGKSISSATYL